VIYAADFLKTLNLGRKTEIGKRVAVIGGGNVAIDAARSALRLEAGEVTIIYRRDLSDMPASAEEIGDALTEGIKISALTSPIRILKKNNTLEMVCIRMRAGEIDSSGRRRPEPIPDSEVIFTFDTIISAVGQTPEIPIQFGLALKGAAIQVDPDTLATNKPGVFAGGDAVSGPASVIQAIAAGRLAAVSIDRYLGGKGDIDETLAASEGEMPKIPEPEEKGRPVMPVMAVKQRIQGFNQVELGYNSAMAVSEAERCLNCDLEEHEDDE
jgi:NADPH-dependent glutamate synthase beta subunit-like oxidoreductase